MTVGETSTGGNGGATADGSNGSVGNNSSFGTLLYGYAGGGGAGFGAGGVMGAFGLRDAAPEGGVVHNSAVNGGLSEFSKCQGTT